MTTPVIFKREGHDVCAFFPTLPGDMNPATMSCYAHVGQHGAADMAYVSNCRPARPHEYADLLAELQRIGYDDLIIRRRMTRRDYETRASELKRA